MLLVTRLPGVTLIAHEAGPELEARYGLFQPRDLLLLGDIELLLPQQRHFSSQGISRVVTRPHPDLAVTELGDRIDGLVQEVAIVRDDNGRSVEILNERL